MDTNAAGLESALGLRLMARCWVSLNQFGRAHLLDTTTTREKDIHSLSSPAGGEGWGEEADLIERPSPCPARLAKAGHIFIRVYSCPFVVSECIVTARLCGLSR